MFCIIYNVFILLFNFLANLLTYTFQSIRLLQNKNIIRELHISGHNEINFAARNSNNRVM
jgi:hypothetical protein